MFLLYLYSLELSNPPLYSELNKAIRDKDQTTLDILGHYYLALQCVLATNQRMKTLLKTDGQKT
jgi:hypothetical protein